MPSTLSREKTRMMTSKELESKEFVEVEGNHWSEKEGEFWVLPLPKFDKGTEDLNISMLAAKQSVANVNLKNKRVLVRVDYNVPLNKAGEIQDDSRITATIPTIKYILDKKPKCVVLICHLGRPGGKFKLEDFSLQVVAPALEKHIGTPVTFIPGKTVGPTVEKAVTNCKSGSVFLLENLRFHIEETGKGVTGQGKKVKADPQSVNRFRKGLSALGDVFVMEAFGAAHRPHSSIVGVDIPQRVAGLLMKKELDVYQEVLGEPKRPFLSIIGGSKVSDKIKVIENMLNLVDEMVIGGGMAYTFKKVIDGVDIGGSLFDKEGAKIVNKIMEAAKKKGVKMHFPVDHIVADKFDKDANTKVVTDKEGVPDKWLALDVGPRSQEIFTEVISRANTILWNGPLGVFEYEKFAGGTKTAMNDLVAATRRGAITVIGGGDTGSASKKYLVDEKPVSELITHCSTGGGSSLVLMEGKALPGVSSLSDIYDLPPPGMDEIMIWSDLKRLQREQRALLKKMDSMKKELSKPPPKPQEPNLLLYALVVAGVANFFAFAWKRRV